MEFWDKRWASKIPAINITLPHELPQLDRELNLFSGYYEDDKGVFVITGLQLYISNCIGKTVKGRGRKSLDFF